MASWVLWVVLGCGCDRTQPAVCLPTRRWLLWVVVLEGPFEGQHHQLCSGVFFCISLSHTSYGCCTLLFGGTMSLLRVTRSVYCVHSGCAWSIGKHTLWCGVVCSIVVWSGRARLLGRCEGSACRPTQSSDYFFVGAASQLQEHPCEPETAVPVWLFDRSISHGRLQPTVLGSCMRHAWVKSGCRRVNQSSTSMISSPFGVWCTGGTSLQQDRYFVQLLGWWTSASEVDACCWGEMQQLQCAWCRHVLCCSVSERHVCLGGA